VNSKQILEHFHLQEIDIIGLTETHHSNHQELFYKYQNDYDTFWSNNSYQFSGVGCFIKKSWSKHIQTIHCEHERYIYIDLYLKDKVKIKIFVIYLHANPSQKNERLELQKELSTYISQALNKKFRVIVMDDFNANLDTYLSLIEKNNTIPWKHQFTHFLSMNNFTDLIEICHETPPKTWFEPNNTCSRIDSIFVSADMIDDFIYYGL